MNHLSRIILSVASALSLGSCFTGIESTPRITSNDVRRRQTVSIAEDAFLSDISDTRPSEWTEGKRFYVTDDKIAIIFSVNSSDKEALAGHELIFKSFTPTSSLTGEGSTDITLTSDRGDDLHYIVNLPYDELMARERFEIPFTIERSVVDAINDAMKGRQYYITTPKWFASDTGKETKALRHVPVVVTSVSPGSNVYPLKVSFVSDSIDGEHFVLMTYGKDKASTRNFSKLFAFENPRDRYNHISDRTWQLIIHSRLEAGMNRDECHLALGAPNSIKTVPTNAAVFEQWSYDDGVYLIFEDNILTRFRI